MIRSTMAAVLAVVVMAPEVPAQAPARLRWKVGQILVYRSEQTTQVHEEVGGTKVDTGARVHLTKCWRVTAVDAAGVATLEQSLRALLEEIRSPTGDVIRYDSANPDKGTPELRKQLEPLVGPALAVLRVDAQGRLIEVKESKFGTASKYKNEMPFAGVLPSEALRAGMAWDHGYQITLDPPLGTGEKFDAVQHYACKSVAGNKATITLATELKSQPAAVGDRVPLLQWQNEGELVFDLEAGRLAGASLRIDKELKGHQGEGSSYRFQSQATEQYVGDR